MSVTVDVDQLAATLADFAVGYLITVGDEYRAHTVAVDPILRDGVLEVGPVGGSTRRNVTGHDGVTLLWPPREPGGYTLIVDGRGELTEAALRVTPRRAVLHRPAGTSHDCQPLS
jgi:hypothetical protein